MSLSVFLIINSFFQFCCFFMYENHEHVKNVKNNDVFSCFATPHLIEFVVRIRCGEDFCLEDAYIPISGIQNKEKKSHVNLKQRHKFKETSQFYEG